MKLVVFRKIILQKIRRFLFICTYFYKKIRSAGNLKKNNIHIGHIIWKFLFQVYEDNLFIHFHLKGFVIE